MAAQTAFDVLAGLLRPYAKDMHTKTDTETVLYLEEDRSGPKPQMFGSVQVKKNYTSFHLFPVYCDPSLLDGVSPALRKRMQGKSCFNFKTADQVPVDEVADLLQRAAASL